MKRYDIEKWFIEKVSGKDTNRPKLQELLDFAREGIAIAKRDGKYKGGKAKTVADFAEHYSRYITRQITKSALARQLGVSRPTLDRLIAEHEQKAGVVCV